MPSDDRLRVGYVLKMYPRFSETFIVNEILAHEAAGSSVEIFSLRPPADGRFHAMLADVRAPVTYLDAGPWRAGAVWDELRVAAGEFPGLGDAMPELLAVDHGDALQAIALARAVRHLGIGHLHAHFGSVATTVARLASLLTGTPYTFTAHAKDIFHADVDTDDLRRKLADATAVVTVSDYNAAFLRARYGPAASRVTRVYNGLDLGRFPYVAPRARPPVIAAVGRLVEKKGFGDLVEACALLTGRGVAFSCRIIGGGPLEPALRARIEALGLAGRVVLLGPGPQDQVRRIVGHARVFAAPCVVGADGNRDGLPTVLLESMALGTPCVSTDVTGIPEVVEDGRTGLVVAQRSPEALADALQRLLADEQLCLTLATRARARVEADFDVHRQAAWLREVITSAAAAGSPRLARAS